VNVISRFALLVMLLQPVGPGVAAQETPTAVLEAEELIAQERLRQQVEEAFELCRKPESDGALLNENFVTATQMMLEAGPGVVPFLVSELDQGLPETYFFCAYALGQLGTPDAEQALRRAIKKAERTPGSFALDRKAWAAYGLGLMGEADAIDALYEGQHLAGPRPMHRGMTLVEAIALLTAPESLSHLVSIQERLAGGGEEMERERTFALRALWRIADSSLVPLLTTISAEENHRFRREAIRALAQIGTPEAMKRVSEALADPDDTVRRLAAIALERSESDIDLARVEQRLLEEDDTFVRGVYYRILADRGGSGKLSVLQKHLGRPDGVDRAALTSVIGRMDTTDSFPLLGRALNDPDSRVAAAAAHALGRLDRDAATDLLLRAVHSTEWTLAQSAVKALVENEVKRAGPVIADRLLNVELKGMVLDPRFRHQIDVLAQALVSLGHHKPLEGLREATERQTDPTLVASLNNYLSQLEELRKNGNDLPSWIEATRSSERAIRVLAYRRIPRFGKDAGDQALVRSFGRVDQEEGVEILDALGRSGTEPAQDLIVRVLTGAEFDSVTRFRLREMAAWSARRIGGERMSDALTQAVERRAGRDATVLVYLAVLEGNGALPVLKTYRTQRLRYLKWSRGEEWDGLDWLARRIAAGRPLYPFDVPPDELSLR
jgi:HEAT repeat protein